jgi:hypothetical protein
VGLDRYDSGYKNIAYAIYLDADGTQPQPAVKLTQVKSLPSSATL